MKNLNNYIKEQLFNESFGSKYMTLSFSGIDGGAETIKSLKSIAQSNAINYTGDDSNVKIEVSQSNSNGIEKIIELVQNFISSIPNDKHDNIAAQLDKLVYQMDAIQDQLDSYNETDGE